MSDQGTSLALTVVQTTKGELALESSKLPNVIVLLDGNNRGIAIKAASSVDIKDSGAILDFGLEARTELGKIAEEMIQGVRMNQLGDDAWKSVEELSKAWKALDPKSITEASRSFLGKAKAVQQAIANWMAGYQQVTDYLRKVESTSNNYRQQMRQDLRDLDTLFMEADKMSTFAKVSEASCLYLMARLIKEYQTQKNNLNQADENALFNLQDMGDLIIQVDRRRFSAYAARGQVVLFKRQIRLIQSMDRDVYGMLVDGLLFTLPELKMTMALMHKLVSSNKALEFVNKLNAMKGKAQTSFNAQVAKQAIAVASASNNADQQIENLVVAYSQFSQLLDEVTTKKEAGAQARRDGEAKIIVAQQTLDKKVGDFDPSSNNQLPEEALKAAAGTL